MTAENITIDTTPSPFAMTYREWRLSPQARSVLRHLKNNPETGLSALDAMVSLGGMTSATLARRICDLEEAGWKIERIVKTNPITRRRYTRYVLKGE